MAEPQAPLAIMVPFPHDELPPIYSKSIPQTHQRVHICPRSAPHYRSHFYHEDQRDEIVPPGLAGAPPPPQYTAFDELLGSFALQAPYIYTLPKGSSPRPRYQISQEHSRSGKLWRLRIRRLLPTESRRLSNPIPGQAPRVEYDDDTTLYQIENLGALSVFKGQNIEIRGRRAKTLPGHITMREEERKCEFWHLKRNPAGDSLKKENERRMHKYGYRSDDEWNKKLLFSAVTRIRHDTVEWRNESGILIATESGASGFDVANEVDQKIRDALITCWVARRWVNGNLAWNTHERGLPETGSL